ncbi:methyltransferase [Bifidobacterium sp. DSM 109958]|uniref:Methyltransferase n=1 Tax=Bifidobacterium moraviense TaxID=2675323 RepID=A0A7Y0EZY2_9BIFI|nr:class I SAM-dependent methyltransferase [Bifidobacterium sp. DSM 109958]NMM99462.1 methyltransferase [Bifidobacterium sp. DSM 109958]
MDKTSYTNLAKAWQYAEDAAAATDPRTLTALRASAESQGFAQDSAAQDDFLRLLVRMTGARSIIAIGTGAVAQTYQLIDGLGGSGLLTAVDSSPAGASAIRAMFNALDDDTDATLRVVNVAVGQFLPRLNAADYDLIVVSGEASNYAPAFAQAERLLRDGGAIIFTDALAFAAPDARGGLLNPADRSPKAVTLRALIDEVRGDERFDTALVPVGTGLLVGVKR